MAIKLNKQEADSLKSYVSSLDDSAKSEFKEKFTSSSDEEQSSIISGLLQEKQTEPQEAQIESAEESAVESRIQEAEARVEERGTFVDEVKDNLKSKSKLKKALGVVQVATAPFSLLESGLSAQAIEIQKGNLNPIDLVKEGLLGFTGQKQSEYGDVFQIAGAHPALAATAGFALAMGSPIATMKSLGQTFGKISKFSDKGLLRAGKNLIKATDESAKYAGNKLNLAYSKVDKIPVEGSGIVDDISTLPNSVVSELEQEIGSRIEVFTENLDISKLRTLKAALGRLRPHSFSKDAKGVEETILDRKINRTYSSLKKRLSETLEKGVKDKKQVKALVDSEEKFVDVLRSNDYLKSIVVEPRLLKPTKGGAVAAGIKDARDVSAREALNSLKSSGPQAKNAINSAITDLEKFNRLMTTIKISKHVASAAIFGGAIGAVGGRTASKAFSGATGQD